MTQSERFLAEEILRRAASGQIPSEGDFLIRGPDGWFFGTAVGSPSDPTDPTDPPAGGAPGGGGSVDFVDLTGDILDVQATESSVKQHEAALDIGAVQVFSGIFGSGTPFPNGTYTFPEQMRRIIRTITAADTPYTVIGQEWHINVNISLGSVEVILPLAITRGVPSGFTDQLHIKRIGVGEGIVTLIPSGGALIDDATSAIIRARNRCFTLVSDSLNWWIQ